MRKSPKISGSLVVAIIAVVASGCAIYFDNAHLKLQKASDQQLDEQHKQAVVKQEERNKQLDEQFERSMELAREALVTDTEHYDELKEQFEGVIAPHVRHEEVYDHVSLLYDRLVLYRDWVSALPYVYSDVVLPYYLEASSNFCKAEEELRAGNFEQAMQSVATAYASLAEGNRAYHSLEKAREAVE